MRFNLRKFITASTLLYCLFLTNGYAADSFDDAIKNATTSGQFRLGYISVAPDVAGSKTTTATGFGGQIKFETEKWKRMQFAFAPYFSEKLDVLSGDQSKNEFNGDFFDSNGESFVYLGEAYVNYALSDGSIRLGRQKLDNPFLNIDEIHILPNTFNAVWLNMNLTDRLILDAGVVYHWAGFDSGQSIDKFKKAGVDGVNALGVSYKMKDHHTFQGWYYDFVDQYSQYYLDANYQNGKFEAGLQYSKYNEVKSSATEGTVWGVKASYELGRITLGLAFNGSSNASGKSQSNGLGGGNFFSSMDETTIGGLTDAMAQVVNVTYAVSDKFSVGLATGHFEDKDKATTNTDQHDIVMTYNINDKLEASFVHAAVKNKAKPADAATNFSRNLARLSYTF